MESSSDENLVSFQEIIQKIFGAVMTDHLENSKAQNKQDPFPISWIDRLVIWIDRLFFHKVVESKVCQILALNAQPHQNTQN